MYDTFFNRVYSDCAIRCRKEMKKDPSLKKVNHSLKQLEVQLLVTALRFVKSDASNEQCARMDVVVNDALLLAQNTLLKAIKIIENPDLLSLVPISNQNNN